MSHAVSPERDAAGASDPWPMGETLVLDATPDAVRLGRRFVERRVQAVGAAVPVHDAAVVAAELLANAQQHGAPPVTVRVGGDSGTVRIEVHDASGHSPVRPAPSTSNMTGRGLALVDALSRRWGVLRDADGGKTVWAELVAVPEIAVAEEADGRDATASLDDWDDDVAADVRYAVVLGDVPTELLLQAKAHIDNLVREFSLAAASNSIGDAAIPEHLARTIETVVHGFADARAAIKRQALAAAARGEIRTRLVLRLPVSAADAGEAYLAALDEADEYARAARLLTLAAPADHRLFRRWYVESLVEQLRSVAVGEAIAPVRSFEDVLLGEVRRLTAAQRVSERAERLQRVTAALARTTRPEDVAHVVVSEGVAALGASGGGLLVPADDGEHLAVPGAVGYGADLVDQLREERIGDPLPAATALRAGTAIWLESRQERDERFPLLHGFEAATVAMCAVPLIVGDRLLGALRFSFDSRKLFDEDERSFVLALAAHTAQTLLRTELYEAEHRAALGLQRALLPDRLIDVPGWDLAAFYSPAGDQEAGGDFYDVFPVAGGRIAAIVGDVMGRGIDAAAAMAQVRATIRAYAVDDPDPSVLFGRVAGFFDTLELTQLATVLYLLVDPASGVVDVGNAGHLPPIVVHAHGADVVPTAVGVPFGVDTSAHETTRVSIPPGSSIVVITDGLVERRGEDIDAGIARVVAAAAVAGERGAEALLSQIIASAPGDELHDDDVTVLLLKRL